MELAHGHKITLEKAKQLGVLDAAEALVREGPDKPWEVLYPADLPVEQQGDGKDLMADHTEHHEEHNVSLYRAMHHLHKGGLHRALGIPKGETIPKEKIEAAKNSKNPHVRHMAHFADTMSHFGK